jgi:GNAT superfamily N-acetyltransferase
MDIIIYPFFEFENIPNFKEKLIALEKESYSPKYGEENCWTWEHYKFSMPHKKELSFYITDLSGELLAYIIASSYTMDGKLTVHYNRAGVDKRYRMLKLGTKLFQAVEKNAKLLGINQLTIEFDQVYLEPFYLKLGYIQFKTKEEIMSFVSSKEKKDVESYLNFERRIYLKKI